MSYALHPLRDQHLAQAETLFQEFPDIFSSEESELWRTQLLKILLKELPHTYAYVATDSKDTVLGAIMFHEDQESQNFYWEIDWLVVRKEQHRQGIGRALVEKALDFMKEKEGTHVYLHTSQAHYNTPTKEFYKKMNFEQLAVFPDYYASNRKNRNENSILFYQHI